MEKQETTFDLDAEDPRPLANKGVEMTILDARQRPTKAKLIVRGTDCDAYNAMVTDQVRRGMDRGPRKLTPSESEDEFYELHATLIVGWPAGQFKKKNAAGERVPFEYSPANAVALLREYQYIFEQVKRFADRRANFLPGPESG